MENKTGLLVGFLVLVIVILLGFVLFAFWVKPTFDGYVVEKRTEGYDIALNSIASTVLQNGFVQIPVGNQTMVLVLAQQQGQQPAQQVQAPPEGQ